MLPLRPRGHVDADEAGAAADEPGPANHDDGDIPPAPPPGAAGAHEGAPPPHLGRMRGHKRYTGVIDLPCSVATFKGCI